MKNLPAWFSICGILILLMLGSVQAAAPSDLRLIDAVKKSDVKSIRSLIAEHVDVNATDIDGSTALLWAAQRDNAEIVDTLLASGANAKAATRYNVTPLSMACVNGNAAIIDRLLKEEVQTQADAQKVASR